MHFSFGVDPVIRKYALSVQSGILVLHGDQLRQKRAEKDSQLLQVIDQMGEASAKVMPFSY